MIYVDSSVALAQLFVEARRPLDAIWSEPLVASRLLQYEVYNRLHAKRAAAGDFAVADQLLEQVALVELGPAVLERALERFPSAVRTLDGLHLATMDYLRDLGQEIRVATFDARLRNAASAMGFAIADC